VKENGRDNIEVVALELKRLLHKVKGVVHGVIVYSRVSGASGLPLARVCPANMGRGSRRSSGETTAESSSVSQLSVSAVLNTSRRASCGVAAWDTPRRT